MQPPPHCDPAPCSHRSPTPPVSFGSFVTVKPAPRDLDCLAVMATGFTTATLSSPVLEVFQHDLCRLYYHTDVFWVTEAVGKEHIDAMLQVFARDRHGLHQPIVEVQL